jgi:hypothetical protein
MDKSGTHFPLLNPLVPFFQISSQWFSKKAKLGTRDFFHNPRQWPIFALQLASIWLQPAGKSTFIQILH